LTIWSGTEIFQFGADRLWAIPLVLLGVSGLAWRLRSAVLLAVGLAALVLVTLFHAGHWGGARWVFSTACGLSVLLVGLSRMCRSWWGERLGGPAVLAFYGQAGFIICAFILSFRDVARELLSGRSYYSTSSDLQGVVSYFPWVVVLAALGVWGWMLTRKLSGRLEVRLGDWLFPIALIYVQAMCAGWFYWGRDVAAWVFNLALLGLALSWMLEGCREVRLSRVILGSVVLASLVFARYFDLFHSLAWRGVAFLVLGAVLFAEGFYYRRMRQVDEGRAKL
jgi:hypothetical protein